MEQSSHKLYKSEYNQLVFNLKLHILTILENNITDIILSISYFENAGYINKDALCSLKA